MRSKNRSLLILGAFLASVSVLLAVSVQFVDNHRWYWNAAHVFCVLGVLSAASGGFLAGCSLLGTQKRRMWLAALGGILGLAWVVSGAAAVGLAFAGMNYFSSEDAFIGWDSYHGDYVVGEYNIRSLQLATLAGLLGGFVTRFGLAPKRKKDSDG